MQRIVGIVSLFCRLVPRRRQDSAAQLSCCNAGSGMVLGRTASTLKADSSLKDKSEKKPQYGGLGSSPAGRLLEGIGLGGKVRGAFRGLPQALLRLGKLICQHVRPRGSGGCDLNLRERIMNVVTSVPYALVGWHTWRKRVTSQGKAWGLSLFGVAAAASGFHASSGKLRPIFRRLDYWAISWSSTLLVKALHPALHMALPLAVACLTPFLPFAMISINMTAVEVEYLRRAWKDTALRVPHVKHCMVAAAGLGFFVYEEFDPQAPLVHTAWHCLSAVGTASTNAVLQYAELNDP